MKKKIFKIRPVDMCIYIDKHAYEENHNVELIFEYLHDLFYSLSIKQRYFTTEENYEQYALYGATQAYLRLTNKRQFLPDDDPKKLPKIKSILNWIKTVMYGFKVNYQNDNFNVTYYDEKNDNDLNKAISNDMESCIRQDANNLLPIEVTSYFSTLPKTIKEFIKTTPYHNDKYISYNLYMSCLITLLRNITLSRYNKNKLDKLKLIPCKDSTLNSIYYEENLNSPVVWGLPEEFKSYVSVITNKIKDIVVKDIRYLISYSEPTQEVINSILMAPYTEFGDNVDE